MIYLHLCYKFAHLLVNSSLEYWIHKFLLTDRKSNVTKAPEYI